MDIENWVDLYGDYLYNYAIYKGLKTMEAEDIVQDTFLAAIKAKDRFQGRSSEKTWLVSILRRKIADFYRNKAKHNQEEIEDYKMPFDEKGHWDSSRVPKKWRLDDDSNLESEEFNKFLLFCLSLLPDKWKSVFVLKHLEEKSSDEICKETGVTSSNYWVIMHRARLKLRECLDKNYFDK